MASRKRSRNDDANGTDDEGVEIESASSNLRTSHPQKRSRLSLARENGGSVVSDDEDLMGIERDASGDPMDDGLSDVELDGEDDDGDDMELYFAQATVREMHEGGNTQFNTASEKGVIEEVFCRNFMCHSKLRVKLGPNINFIVGHNGSGKSAVLTALQICLGGKAQAVNRATSLKGMIKEGEESSTLAVKIKNRGEDAWQPHLYGESITVERHFSRSGGSGFRIKSDQDKTVTTRKSDLDDILDYFAFQLDNPINVLTQDMARQFLSNSAAKDKYDFFMSGTQLEALCADYNIMADHLDIAELKLSSRTEDVTVLKEKVRVAKKKKDAVDRMESLESRILEAQWMHAWAQVEEAEREVEKSEQKIEAARSTMQEKQTNSQTTESALERKTQARDAAQQSLAELNTQREPLVESRDKEKADLEQGKKELTDLLAQQRGIKGTMKEARKQIKAREDEIALERSRLAAAEGSEHAERLSRLEELQNEVEEAKRAVENHLGQRTELENKVAKASKDVNQKETTAAQAREKVFEAENSLRQMERAKPDASAGYRKNMANLVRAIDREKGWKSKPIGPMGAHVKLLDERWMSIIEKTFGGALDSFVVSCVHDSKLLSNIMEQRDVACPVPILNGSAKRLDTSDKEPDSNVATILRVLEIDNDAVRNQMIINHVIEQTCLIGDRDEAVNFLYGGSGRPRNVKAAICFAARRGEGTRFEYSRTGAEKSNPVGAWTGPTRMKSDHEQQIRIQRNNVQNAKRDQDAADTTLRAAQEILKSARQELERWKRQHNQLVADQQGREDAAQNLQHEIDSNRPQDGKLQELEQQLKDTKEELEQAESQAEDVINARDAIDKKQKEINARMVTAQRELDRMDERCEGMSSEIANLELERSNALSEHNRAHLHIQNAEKEVQKAQEQLERDQRGLENMLEGANLVTSNRRVAVEAGMTSEKLDERVDKLCHERDERRRRLGGSEQELRDAYRDAKEGYLGAQRQLESMESVAKMLKNTIINRRHRWRVFRRFISCRANTIFKYLLSERQFRGQVLINHDTKELDIQIEPDSTRASDTGRQAKTLSGGEKSFSTTCLLLSIWESLGSPIRCLDEFDVFMDSVNRAQSTKLLIQAARRAIGRQFIFITPQAMNNVELGQDVRIHKMGDPERGQQTLPF